MQTARLSAAIAGPVGPDGGHHPESGQDPGAYTIPPYINALVFRDQASCRLILGLVIAYCLKIKFNEVYLLHNK